MVVLTDTGADHADQKTSRPSSILPASYPSQLTSVIKLSQHTKDQIAYFSRVTSGDVMLLP